MTKSLKLFVLILLISFVFLGTDNVSHAASAALSMTITCPERAYLGESFVCQVDIHNNDSVSHNYVLWWIVDNTSSEAMPTFNSSAVIQSNETASLPQSFVFAPVGYHFIALKLFQDDLLVDETDPYSPISVEVVKIDTSIAYLINPSPIYPNSSFTMSLWVRNESPEAINSTRIDSISIVPPDLRDKFTQTSSTSTTLGLIAPGAAKNVTYFFDVAHDTLPGTYSFRVSVDFWDSRDNNYINAYYVQVVVSSRETLDAFSNFQLQVQNSLDKFRYDLGVLQQSVTVVTIFLLIVMSILAIVNMWYARRLSRIRRKLAS
jgi:hypothetical protein